MDSLSFTVTLFILYVIFLYASEKIFSAGVDRKIHQFDLLNSKNSSKWTHSFNRLLHSNDVRSLAIFENKNYNLLVSGGVERAIVVQNIETFYDGKYTLMSKLTLSADENITSVDFKDNLLVVAKMTSVRFFELTEISDNKFKIQKIRDDKFDSLVEGAKIVKFIDANKVLILTPDEELYTFDIDSDEGKIELNGEIELLESTQQQQQQQQRKNQHLLRINNLVLTPNKKQVIISRFNGSIEVLPRQFISLQDKPEGMFIQQKQEKLWIYGSTWLSFFDLSMNIPISKIYKNTSTSKKRNHDGLSMNEEIGELEDETEEIIEASLKQSEIDRLRHQIQTEDKDNQNNVDKTKKPFWITEKYRPIMKVANFGGNDDIIVVERPYSSLQTGPAFDLPKIKV